MAALYCPSCNSMMQEIAEPDIIIDKCPQCEGIFLDKGELNLLTTGMPGDIEYCSIDEELHLDTFPTRICPKCSSQTMRKINLLTLADLIFDYCPKCEGFFLDAGELEAMHTYLNEIMLEGQTEKNRYYHNNHLIIIDQIHTFATSMWDFWRGQRTNLLYPSTYIRIRVYFTSPLDIELRIFREQLVEQLMKVFGLFKNQDIQTNNAVFDRLFIVQGKDKSSVLSILSHEFQDALVEFVQGGPSVLSRVGLVEIYDNFIYYTEGPYSEIPQFYLPKSSYFIRNLPTAADPIIDKLLTLVTLLESSK